MHHARGAGLPRTHSCISFATRTRTAYNIYWHIYQHHRHHLAPAHSLTEVKSRLIGQTQNEPSATALYVPCAAASLLLSHHLALRTHSHIRRAGATEIVICRSFGLTHHTHLPRPTSLSQPRAARSSAVSSHTPSWIRSWGSQPTLSTVPHAKAYTVLTTHNANINTHAVCRAVARVLLYSSTRGS